MRLSKEPSLVPIEGLGLEDSKIGLNITQKFSENIYTIELGCVPGYHLQNMVLPVPY